MEHYQVFISYSREHDLQTAVNLQQQLERAGLSVFRDEGAIHEGDRWLEKLQQAISACDCFVLLAGHAGVQRWVAAETEVAQIRHIDEADIDKRLPIFPFLIGHSPVEILPPFLRLIQATHWDGESSLDPTLIERIREKTAPDSELITIESCPFVGLDAYRPEQSHLFFGRQLETLKALALFDTTTPGKQDKWLEISGNSGSGKSSLMNAGLLPLIKQGWLFPRTRIPNWKLLGPLMPGEQPVANLAGLLAREFGEEKADVRGLLEADQKGLADWLSSRKQEDTAFILAVDQFEELFSIANSDERQHFDRILAYALQDDDCPLFLLSTIRADFQDRFDSDLPRLLSVRNEQGNSWSLPLIGDKGLGEIIDGPSRLAGLDANEIRAAILLEAKDELGALPLVENALEWLWNNSEGNKLSGQLFSDHGGLAGILSESADELVRSFGSREQQHHVLEFLFNLVKPDPEQRLHTRRRLEHIEAIELAGGGDEEKGRELINHLAGYQQRNGANTQATTRLITIADGYVNLIHETLVRKKRDEQGQEVGYWPKLWKYIEKEKDRVPLRDRLKEDAKQWSQHGLWGRFIHAPGWNDRRKYKSLARLPQEKRYLKAGRWRACTSVVALVLLLVGFSMALSEDFKTSVFHWAENIPKIVKVKRKGPALPKMVSINSGSLMLPGDGDKPEREVSVRKNFSMGKYEVTFAQYDDFVRDKLYRRDGLLDLPDDEGWGRGDLPVINVSWRDAVAYTDWLSGQEYKTCTLPTEAQWEYAARAGTKKAYGIPADTDGSDNIRGLGLANCDGCQKGKESIRRTTPGGSFPANKWGLHDMHGNAWEWVLNEYENPENTSVEGSVPRVLRGGSWLFNPDGALASVRGRGGPGDRDGFIGFRVVCSSPIKR